MTLRTFFIGRTIGFIVILALLGGYFLLSGYFFKEKQEDSSAHEMYEPYRGMLTGEYLCLPPKDTAAEHTMECAFGMKTDAGEYYAVDFNLMSQTRDELAAGDRFTANGLVTPVQRLSSDYWQKFPIVGIFSITDLFQKE